MGVRAMAPHNSCDMRILMPLHYLDCSVCEKMSTYQSYEKPLTRCRWCNALFAADTEPGMVLSPPPFGPVWYVCHSCGAKALSGYRMIQGVGSVFDDIQDADLLITDVQRFLKIGSEG
jgi:hypothetical protein